MNRKFQCAMVFGDNMVLQREKPVSVFGTGEDGKEVTVEFQGQKVSAVIKEGKWKAILAPLTVCEGEELKVFCEDEEIRFQNVSVGEVWLAGGQSNMEFYFRYDADHDAVIENCENPQIRFFDYPEISYEGQLEARDYSKFGFWRSANKENMDYFSAVGYYFAAELQKKYQCPIGIVGCNWGGTTACSWMDPSYLEDNEGKVWLEDYEKAVENLDLEKYIEAFEKNPSNYHHDPFGTPDSEGIMYGYSREGMKKMIAHLMEVTKGNIWKVFRPLIGPRYECRPGGLYETMLKKLVPYAVRGVIWYQGEADVTHPEIYDTVFSALIRCWRDLWQEELPFLFVQLTAFREWLPGCTGEKYPIIREKQEKVAETVPNTWMVSIMDVGMEWDIHPKKKAPVGKRLALVAEGKVYGEDILCEAPACDRMEVSDGEVILYFEHTGTGLSLKGEKINALELLSAGEKIEEYEATVLKDRIVIKSDCIRAEKGAEIRFAVCDYCEVNLYNSADFPAKPFKMSVTAE